MLRESLCSLNITPSYIINNINKDTIVINVIVKYAANSISINSPNWSTARLYLGRDLGQTLGKRIGVVLGTTPFFIPLVFPKTKT